MNMEDSGKKSRKVKKIDENKKEVGLHNSRTAVIKKKINLNVNNINK